MFELRESDLFPQHTLIGVSTKKIIRYFFKLISIWLSSMEYKRWMNRLKHPDVSYHIAPLWKKVAEINRGDLVREKIILSGSFFYCF